MKKLFTILACLTLSWSLKAQYDETIKVNNFVVNYFGERNVKDSLNYYISTLAITDLETEYDEAEYQEETSEYWIKKQGVKEFDHKFFLIIKDDELGWVTYFSTKDQSTQISIGERLFNMSETKSSTLFKLNKGYEQVKGNPNHISILCYDAVLLFYFKDEKLYSIEYEAFND